MLEASFLSLYSYFCAPLYLYCIMQSLLLCSCNVENVLKLAFHQVLLVSFANQTNKSVLNHMHLSLLHLKTPNSLECFSPLFVSVTNANDALSWRYHCEYISFEW